MQDEDQGLNERSNAPSFPPFPCYLPPSSSQASFTRQGEDQGLIEVAMIRVPVEAEIMPTKLRIDVGWSTWKKPKVCVWGGPCPAPGVWGGGPVVHQVVQ